MRYYNIDMYASVSDYEGRIKARYIDGFTNKREAIKEAKTWLKDFPVIKVVSSDYQFIEVYTQNKEIEL